MPAPPPPSASTPHPIARSSALLREQSLTKLRAAASELRLHVSDEGTATIDFDKALRRDLARTLEPRWRTAYEAGAGRAYKYTPEDKGLRRLRVLNRELMLRMGRYQRAATRQAQRRVGLA